MIFVEKDAPLSRIEVDHRIEVLTDAVRDSAGEVSSARIKKAFVKVIPTFRDPDEINSKASEAEEMQNYMPVVPQMVRSINKRSTGN